MSGIPSATRVLRLYRRILREGRRWEGPAEERDYIAEEARRLFRQNAVLHGGPEELERKMFEGESRLEIGLHYRIPYPRFAHFDKNTTVSGLGRDRKKPDLVLPAYMDSYGSSPKTQ